MTLTDWNPTDYLKFDNERSRAAVDLAARIALDAPKRVIDLGCGPGNSTKVLRRRWPDARIIGLDHSETMIEAARRNFPHQEWICGDINALSWQQDFDVVFSNAALQWIPDHGPLIDQLYRHVAPAGALAFQIPSADGPRVRTLIDAIAKDGGWSGSMDGPLNALTMMPPSFYYDRLAHQADRLDLWETEYLHVLDGPEAVVDWISSTGLRPYLACLEPEREQPRFLEALQERVREAYPRQGDGKVLFPFKRTFVIAYQSATRQ